jgi:hypothetical protein
MIITTILAFGEWQSIFSDPKMTRTPRAAIGTPCDEPAETWRWEAMPKRWSRDFKMAAVQVAAGAAGKDPFLVFLGAMSPEPN